MFCRDFQWMTFREEPQDDVIYDDDGFPIEYAEEDQNLFRQAML